MDGMTTSSLSSITRNADTPEVDEAERKVAGVLDDLERKTDGEVRKLALDDLVDTDADGRPVVKKSVDIELQRRQRHGWSR